MHSAQCREQLDKGHNKPYLSTVVKKKKTNTTRCESEAPEGTMAWKAVVFGGLYWTSDQDPVLA